MIPPFKLTSKIMTLVSDISHLLGRLDSVPISKPEPKLRRKNRIRTIKATLAIEGNTFTEEQITSILENKKVIGSKKEIVEVQNSIEIYEGIDKFKMDSGKFFLKAHSELMKGLISSSGKYRIKNVGILKGTKVKHVAPKPLMVPELMNNLFKWIKDDKETHYLIKSCVVHYEIEFIHPFEDGNGRMGRFWQTLILATNNAVFKYVPIESLIEKNQQEYYETLELSDKAGDSTLFVEFMLGIIFKSLKEFDSEIVGVVLTSKDRFDKAHDYFKNTLFSRKQYMELFKSISSATASRDLKEGIELGLLISSGTKNQTKYKFKK
jgi:Fic family protein